MTTYTLTRYFGWLIVLFLGIGTLLGSSWMAQTSQAAPQAVITVNSSADVVADDGVCTLREAITAANTDTPSGASIGECGAGNGADTIVFSDTNAPFTVTLAITGTREDGNATGDLDIFSDVTIQGNPTFTTTINAKQIDRVLDVMTGTVVYLSHLRIYRGHAPNGEEVMGLTDGEVGGGIRSSGSLTIHMSWIANNRAGSGNMHAGNGAAGGGIWNSGTLTVSTSIVRFNEAGNAVGFGFGRGGDGAGIFTTGKTFIINSHIHDNKAGHGIVWQFVVSPPQAGGDGGGIYSVADLAVISTTITHNDAGHGSQGFTEYKAIDGGTGGYGGGLYLSGTASILSSTIGFNETGTGGNGDIGGKNGPGPSRGGNGGHGGGIMVSTATIPITATSIHNNLTGRGGIGGYCICPERPGAPGGNGGQGGGIALRYAGITMIQGSILYDNVAQLGGEGGGSINGEPGPNGDPGRGGGTYTDALIEISRSTISGNTAQNHGGGIYSTVPNIVVQDSTIAMNRSVLGSGGGIALADGASAILGNTIVGDNQAEASFDCLNEIQSNGYLLIEATSGCLISGETGANIYGQPPHLTTLADNGGPTLTHAFAEGSPAIDHGDCTATTDQRGEPRPIDLPAFPNGAGNTCDIGAFESQPPKTYPTHTLTPTPTVTPTFMPSNTPTTTGTPTSTRTPTPTTTVTPSPTPTVTLTPSATIAPTYTFYPTYTPLATHTPFPTWTPPPGLQELYLPLLQRDTR